MKRFKWNRKLSVLVLIMFITVTFASFNTNLFIDGNAYVRVDRDIRITNIHLLETEYNGYENIGSEYTNRTISTDVSLPRQASSVTYEVTITNVSDRRYKITDIIEDSYDNKDVKYELIDASIGNIVEPHTTKTFKVKFTNNVQVVEEDDVNQAFIYNFGYTGDVQEFIVPFDGDYTFEVWGAQGGNASWSDHNMVGGYGGYSKGTVHLTKNTVLYIYVGGAGVTSNTKGEYLEGGYNGGGKGRIRSSGTEIFGSGGGATHISLVSQELQYLEAYKDKIYIVAGGGGGAGLHTSELYFNNGGAGGGIKGNGGTTGKTNSVPSGGGTQTAGGSNGSEGYKGKFGLGATHYATNLTIEKGAGGGGGFYGGGNGCAYGASAAGGSGYIGNTDLTDKEMYCYQCTESSVESTKTISTDTHSATPTANTPKEGSGYAKITVTHKIVDDDPYYFDYTGAEQTFIAPYSGLYKLETWGAQGLTDYHGTGGYGGYARGVAYFTKGTQLSIVVGGSASGYNGGGNKSSSGVRGGGATHIATNSGVLSSYSSVDQAKQYVYIVAGGGGGSGDYNRGGSGGGIKGTAGEITGNYVPDNNHSLGGTQTSGWAFGKGEDAWAIQTPGGGGGWYGGYAGGAGDGSGAPGTSVSAGGGSGYIGNPNLSDKIMYCFKCEESQDIETRTVSTQSHSSKPKQNQAKEGNGYSKITLLKRTINQTKLTLDFTFEEYVNGNEYVFGYTGSPQEFTVPKTGYYQIELWGASGENYRNEYVQSLPTYGGYTSGKIKLNKGEKLYVYVGDVDYTFNNSLSKGSSARSGGATDVRLKQGTNWYDLDSLSSRIMVAAGAGGTYADQSAPQGGSAGGLVSYAVNKTGYHVNVTTQTAGGAKTISSGTDYYGLDGAFGVGADNNRGNYSNGAGGYYGGGSGPAGGGGSSFISGHNGCVAIIAESDTTPRNDSNGNQCADGTTDITCSKHYSNYVFTDTVMIDGKGYNWTTEVGNQVVGMPTHDGTSTMTGNDGAGFAKITCLEEITDYSFEYTGDVQEFVAPYNGIYKVELWGAQGGSLDGNSGFGGYSTGNINLSKNEKLYITVGGEGESILTEDGYNNKGGYNGGGSSSFHEGMTNASKRYAGFGGGGATHISTTNRGELKNFSDNRDEVLMVAGGGGGDSRGNAEGVPVGTGGAGGGTISGHGSQVDGSALNPPENATQDSGYSFGEGESLIQYTDSNNTGKYVNQNSLGNCGGGGGGGWYGGYTYHACRAPGAAGGSGYIKTTALTDYQMFCYQDCTGNNTTVTENYGHAKSEYANTGDGFARITLIQKIDTYDIKYDLNGGSLDNPRMTYSNFDDNITLQTPTRTGYTFAGWSGGKNKLDYTVTGPNSNASVSADGLISSKNATTDDRGWGYSNQGDWYTELPKGTYTLSLQFEHRSDADYATGSGYVIYTLMSNNASNQNLCPLTNIYNKNVASCTFTLNQKTKVGIMAKVFNGTYRIQIEEGTKVTSWEAYSSDASTSKTIPNGSTGTRRYTAMWKNNDILCRKATTLHETTCRANQGTNKCCQRAGYATGDPITYGSIVDGNYKSGDAFDCDVNGDGIFDSDKERFYYLTDLDSDSNYVVLLYSYFTSRGVANDYNPATILYDSSGENWHGPRTAYIDLPTTSQWSNVSLTNPLRQIRSGVSSTTTTGGDLPIFDFTGKAARMPTKMEISTACNNEYDLLNEVCEFTMENTSYDLPFNGWGLWMETPYVSHNQKVWYIDSHWQDLASGYYANQTTFRVKPVIEVPKSRMEQ